MQAEARRQEMILAGQDVHAASLLDEGDDDLLF